MVGPKPSLNLPTEGNKIQWLYIARLLMFICFAYRVFRGKEGLLWNRLARNVNTLQPIIHRHLC